MKQKFKNWEILWDTCVKINAKELCCTLWGKRGSHQTLTGFLSPQTANQAKRHVLKWLRHTCATTMLSNHHLDVARLWGGIDYPSKGKTSENKICEMRSFCRTCFTSEFISWLKGAKTKRFLNPFRGCESLIQLLLGEGEENPEQAASRLQSNTQCKSPFRIINEPMKRVFGLVDEVFSSMARFH